MSTTAERQQTASHTPSRRGIEGASKKHRPHQAPKAPVLLRLPYVGDKAPEAKPEPVPRPQNTDRRPSGGKRKSSGGGGKRKSSGGSKRQVKSPKTANSNWLQVAWQLSVAGLLIVVFVVAYLALAGGGNVAEDDSDTPNDAFAEADSTESSAEASAEVTPSPMPEFSIDPSIGTDANYAGEADYGGETTDGTSTAGSGTRDPQDGNSEAGSGLSLHAPDSHPDMNADASGPYPETSPDMYPPLGDDNSDSYVQESEFGQDPAISHSPEQSTLNGQTNYTYPVTDPATYLYPDDSGVHADDSGAGFDTGAHSFTPGSGRGGSFQPSAEAQRGMASLQGTIESPQNRTDNDRTRSSIY